MALQLFDAFKAWLQRWGCFGCLCSWVKRLRFPLTPPSPLQHPCHGLRCSDITISQVVWLLVPGGASLLPGWSRFSIAWVFELETPDYQALELDKNAGNLWTEQIPLIADCLHREAKFRSKSKHAPAEGEAGEKR